MAKPRKSPPSENGKPVPRTTDDAWFSNIKEKFREVTISTIVGLLVGAFIAIPSTIALLVTSGTIAYFIGAQPKLTQQNAFLSAELVRELNPGYAGNERRVSTAVAKCPEGTIVISGECRSQLNISDKQFPILERFGVSSDNTWRCTWSGNVTVLPTIDDIGMGVANSPPNVSARAYCLRP